MRKIVAEIKCTCGRKINVRLRALLPSDERTVPCWNCRRSITLRGTSGYVDGKPASYTDVLSDEVIKTH